MKTSIVYLLIFSVVFSLYGKAQSNCDFTIHAGEIASMNHVAVNATLNGPSNDFVNLDLDNDGIDDIQFNAFYAAWGNSINSTLRFFLLHPDISVINGNFDPLRLNAGDSIAECSNWYYSPNMMYLGGIMIEPMYLIVGDWRNQAGYLGFKISHPLDTIYGWVSIQGLVSEYSCQITIYDYAYKSLTAKDRILYLESDFTVFPNPVTDLLQCTYPDNFNATAINIKSIDGKLIAQYKGYKISGINTENLPAGIYFLEFITADSRIYKKFVKQ